MNDIKVDLGNYKELGDSEQKERGFIWSTAIGLQSASGAKPSEYLISVANMNINGDITMNEAKALIDKYYDEKVNLKITQKITKNMQLF
ncbi:MAG: antitoxin VbhA family protein [Firmicutes bacterium]|nr:antitoxin VbhA family protein [Bacillota bacterium]